MTQLGRSPDDESTSFKVDGSVDWTLRPAVSGSLRIEFWSSIVFVGGVFVLLSAAVQTYKGLEPFPLSLDYTISQLQAIRGVLLAILGGKMISWSQKRWAAKFSTKEVPSP